MNSALFGEFANEIIKMSGLLGSDKSMVEGLTPKQVHILMEIGNNSFRHGDLAKSLGVDPSTLTRTLDPLAKAGLVDRQLNPDNRREVLIRLSQHGLTVLRDIEKKMIVIFDQILAHVPDNQVQQVESTLKLLLNLVKEFNQKQ